MKRIFLFIIAATVISIAVFLSAGIAERIAQNEISTLQIQRLPDMDLKCIKQACDTANKYIILNYFSPDCDHCQHTATELLAKKDLFNDVHFCMITVAEEERTRKFIDDYNLGTLPFLSIYMDVKGSFFKNFNTTIVPSFYLYGRDHFLITTVKKSIELESLIHKVKCDGCNEFSR